MFSAADHEFMSRALQLAARGLYTTTPNPRVGCVIVRGGAIVGEGWHEQAGGAHAEVLAIAAAGELARGATAYVSLEPCSFQGRTPPCTDALIAAGITRVVAAMEDPNPLVDGIAPLRDAGIDVAVGLLEDDARELNIGFVSRMTRGRPWVRLKVAASLDGKTALESGLSQWITGGEARKDGHRWRARACAILTGIGTILDDDPQLTVRDLDTPRQPLRVVVDSRLELPLGARILDAGGGAVLVAAAVEDVKRIAALERRGAEVVLLPNAKGKVDLSALLKTLARRGMNEVHVEAGFKLNGSLVQEACVDEMLIYLAPCLLGSGRDMFNLRALTTLTERRSLAVRDTRAIGEDWRILARFRDPDCT